MNWFCKETFKILYDRTGRIKMHLRRSFDYIMLSALPAISLKCIFLTHLFHNTFHIISIHFHQRGVAPGFTYDVIIPGSLSKY